MKAAIYARSGNKNKKSHLKLKMQMQELQQFADLKNYGLVLTEHDFGSGLDKKRPAFQKVINAVNNKNRCGINKRYFCDK